MIINYSKISYRVVLFIPDEQIKRSDETGDLLHRQVDLISVFVVTISCFKHNVLGGALPLSFFIS